MALNNNYSLLLNNYIGNFGGVNGYLRVYAKIERQDLINNKSYVAIKQVFYATADYIYSGNNTHYLNSNIGNSGTITGGMTFHSGETLLNTVYAWITHNSEGKFTLSGTAYFYSNAWGMGASGNYSAELPQIPRNAKLGIISIFNIEDGITIPITINNPTFSNKLVIKQGNNNDNTTKTIKTIENLSDDYELNFNQEELNNIYSFMSNNETVPFIFELSSYNGTTQIGSIDTKTVNGTIIDANPVFVDFTYQSIDNLTQILTGSNNKIIKGISTLRISDIVANPLKSANLALVQIGTNQYEYTENFTKEIENWEDTIINCYIIDSRNKSTKLEKLIGANFINYTKPVITEKSILRQNSINEESILSFSGIWDNKNFGAVSNNLKASYKYKETNSDEWIDGTSNLLLDIDNNNFSYSGFIKGDLNNGFSADKSYRIKINISDSCYEINQEIILNIGEPAIDIYKNRISFGKAYNEELGGKIQGIYEEGDIFLSMNDRNPSIRFGGIWELIAEGKMLVGVDPNDSDFNFPEKSGGEKTHTLTIEEMPNHTHNNWMASGGSWARETICCGNSAAHSMVDYGTITSTGGSKEHNNMSPFLTCYIWKKIS